jgi:hypothetical protein
MTRAPIKPTAARSPLALNLAAVWQGFVTPSPFAFAGMMAIFVAVAVAIFAGLTPQRISGPLGVYLPRSVRDHEAFATREAIRLSLPPAAGEPQQRVYVISDSVLAHAFASDTRLAAAITAASGRPTRVGFLATPLQGPIDQAALADVATRSRPGVVVLGLAFDEFAVVPSHLLELDRLGRLGVRSDWADADVRSLGGTPRPLTGNYVIDNRNFVLRNLRITLGRAALGRPALRRIDDYLPTPPVDPAYAGKVRAVMLGRLRTLPTTDTAGVVILTDTVRRLQARGNRVLLVEAPLSARLLDDPADQQRYAAYLTWSAALSRSLGTGYCRLADHYAPPPSAFPDLIHIVDPVAQARLRQALAACITALPPTGSPA